MVKLVLQQGLQIQQFRLKKQPLRKKSLPMARRIQRKTPLRMIQSCEQLQLMTVIVKQPNLVATVKLQPAKTVGITIQTVVQKPLLAACVMHHN